MAHQQRLLTVLDGAAELTVYGAVDRALTELSVIDDELRSAEARIAWGAGLARRSASSPPALDSCSRCGSGHGGCYRHLDGVTLAVVVLLPLSVHELVALLTPAAAQLPSLAESARRLLEVLDEPDVVPDPESPEEVPLGALGLSLTDVSVGWPSHPRLLAGLTLDVEARSVVGLVGPSGVGKSTLAATLLRFIDPVAGRIELVGADGAVDMARLRGDDVRRAVGWCSQDAHVFDSTVAANLRLARPTATDDELQTALTAVQLDDWLERLPAGLSRWWANTVRPCRAANGNVWCWHAWCCPRHPSSSSTSPPNTSTRRRRGCS